MNTSLLLVAAAVALAPAGATAASFTAHLTHDQETTTGVLLTSGGDPRPLSYGWATFFLNDAQTELRFTADIYHLDITGAQTPLDTFDDLRAAHIHAGPLVAPGVNGPVVFGFFGAPFNDTNPNDVVVTPFVGAVGGVFSAKWDLNEGQNTTLLAQLPHLNSGRAYLNFHTAQFPAGEIRGQILRVPDAASSGLLVLLGMLGLLGFHRRQRSARD